MKIKTVKLCLMVLAIMPCLAFGQNIKDSPKKSAEENGAEEKIEKSFDKNSIESLVSFGIVFGDLAQSWKMAMIEMKNTQNQSEKFSLTSKDIKIRSKASSSKKNK